MNIGNTAVPRRGDTRTGERGTDFPTRLWFCVVLSLFSLAGCDPQSPPATPPASNGRPPQRSPVEAAPPESREIAVDPADLQPRPGDWFHDVTDASGIDFTCLNGRDGHRYFLIESFGGGTAVFDYDGDGDLDLFFTGGGTISATDPVQIRGRLCPLYQNQGQFQFHDVTPRSGLISPDEFTQGCAIGDYDEDGFPDLFICGIGKSRLIRNQGDGTFVELPEAALAAPGWGTAAAFGDIDGDGFADILLTRYTNWSPEIDVDCRNFQGIRDLCGPTSYAGTTSLLLHNTGQGTFEDWSERAGVTHEVRGLGVAALDLNDDGQVDFFVASDESPNRLYLGGASLPLTESAELAGLSLGEWGSPQGSMGIGVADYNHDGLPDLFITNFENEDDSLYRNVGQGLFVHGGAAAGLSGLTRMRVGFGTAFADFDLDGWPDLFVLNGNTSYSTGQSSFRQIPQLFQNRRGERFTEVTPSAGGFFRSVHAGRGSAVGDLDNDGSPDLVTVQINEPVRIQRNQHTPRAFCSIQLVARFGPREAVGARVWQGADRLQTTQFVTRGTGFFSQSDPRILFPLSSANEPVVVTVAWPGRKTERFENLTQGRTTVLIEGTGRPIDE
jgi:enediyne biosynthesis protein E4